MKIPRTKNAYAPFPLSRLARLGCFVFGVLHPGPLTAQEPSSPAARGALPYTLLRIIRSGDSVDKIREKLLSKFKEADIDGNGVSITDYKLAWQLKAAASRASVIRAFFSKDLNGNGVVERKELQIYHRPRAQKPLHMRGDTLFPTKEQIEKKLNTLIIKDLAADTDNDGAITIAEVSAWAARQDSPPVRPVAETSPLLSMDVDGDGAVSEAEFTRSLDRFLEIHDVDGDGRISVTEKAEINRKEKESAEIFYAAARHQRLKERMRRLGESCGFPRPTQKSKILLVGTLRGDALSTVSLGGDDIEVSVSDVRVEPGNQSLYILLTSGQAMIWRFKGAVDRVAQVVASSNRRREEGVPHAGITGLPAARVLIVPEYDCLDNYWETDSGRARQTAQMVSHLLGRGADLVVGRPRVGRISLPSGVVDSAFVLGNVVDISNSKYGDSVQILSGKIGASLSPNSRWLYRGGLVRINPKAVVSRSPTKTYAVLPHYAGLSQLVGQGAMRIIERPHGEPILMPSSHGPPGMFSRLKSFLVLKKIQYPTNLDSSVLFVLAPGVETPSGSPGSSKTIRQKNFKP